MSSLELFQSLPSIRALPFRVGIVGGGRVGGALARGLAPQVAWVVARSTERRHQLRQWLEHIPLVGTLSDIATLPEVVILAVPDSALHDVALTLARRYERRLKDILVCHCSGVQTRSILAPVETFGALTGTAHPFTMIPEPDPTWLYGAVWGIEGEKAAMERIEQVVGVLGGTAYHLGDVSPERKALYHLTAVLASNVTTSAIAAAIASAEGAAVPADLFLPPILRATIENAINAIRRGGTIPRTGPLERGDMESIERHLLALASYPSLLQQYCAYLIAMLSERKYLKPEVQSLLQRYCPLCRHFGQSSP